MCGAVRAAVAFFGLGTVSFVERIQEGSANRNYFIDSDRGLYVVKEVREHAAEEVALELAYIDRVTGHGIPAPTYLEGATGNRIFQFENRPMLALKRVHGQHPDASPSVGLEELTDMAMISEGYACYLLRL